VEREAQLERVPVTFDLERGRRQVTIRTGGEEIDCQTPCTVELPPGEVEVRPTAGSWADETRATIPDHAMVATLVRDRGRRLFIAGLSLLAAGAGVTVIGLAAGAATDNPMANYGPAAYAAIPGGLAFLTGLVLLAVAPESYRLELTPAAE
jgi:hypothetical protein